MDISRKKLIKLELMPMLDVLHQLLVDQLQLLLAILLQLE